MLLQVMRSVAGKYTERRGQRKTVCLAGSAFWSSGSKRKKEEYVTLQVIKDSSGNKEHLDPFIALRTKGEGHRV